MSAREKTEKALEYPFTIKRKYQRKNRNSKGNAFAKAFKEIEFTSSQTEFLCVRQVESS